jgi:hypothetical protein
MLLEGTIVVEGEAKVQGGRESGIDLRYEVVYTFLSFVTIIVKLVHFLQESHHMVLFSLYNFVA